MASSANALRIQVCYARPDLQRLVSLSVAEGTTIGEAISLSGISAEVGGQNIAACKVGIYGKLKTPDTHLREGDRIEIYRPLLADPKEARRRRAAGK